MTCTLPVRVGPEDAVTLERRFEQARMMLNLCLQESRKRLALLKAHPTYLSALEAKKEWHQSGHRMVRELGPEDKWPTKLKAQRARELKAISLQFQEARNLCAFSDYSLQKHALQARGTSTHLGPFARDLHTHVVQKLATRAFKACEASLILKRGVPRFKPASRPLGSVESKSNDAGLIFKATDATLRWGELKLEVLYDEQDPYHRQAFESRTKYVRLLRKTIRGKVRYFAQLVLEGAPLQKRPDKVASGCMVGLDIGPSSLAAVGDDAALLIPFCPELKKVDTVIRRLSRKLDRQRRAGNPDNYGPDGQIKRGIKLHWNVSTSYRKVRSRLAELHRRLAEHRKSLQGKVTNDLLELGTVFRTEKLSMKAWQKVFGRSVGRNAPGMFHSLLQRKAERAGGEVQWVSPWKTALSQHCVCGARKKKPLSQRVHACICQADGLQRDVLSAYLARHTEQNIVGWEGVKASFPGVEVLLRSAHREAGVIQRSVQAARGGPRSPYLATGQSCSTRSLEVANLRLLTEAHTMGEVRQADGTPRL